MRPEHQPGAPECGAATSRPGRQLFWPNSVKSRGLGTESPKEKRYDSCSMRSATCWIITGMMTAGMIFGQTRSSAQVKVLTVCEVLGNVPLYADTAVAVVGRLERTVSLTDHSEFLCRTGVNIRSLPTDTLGLTRFRSGLLGKRGCQNHRATGRSSNARSSPRSYRSSVRPQRWVPIKSRSSKPTGTRLCTVILPRCRMSGPLYTGGS